MRDGADGTGVQGSPDGAVESDRQSDGDRTRETTRTQDDEWRGDPVPIEPETPELENVLFVLLGVVITLGLLFGGV